MCEVSLQICQHFLRKTKQIFFDLNVLLSVYFPTTHCQILNLTENKQPFGMIPEPKSLPEVS